MSSQPELCSTAVGAEPAYADGGTFPVRSIASRCLVCGGVEVQERGMLHGGANPSNLLRGWGVQAVTGAMSL